MSLAIMLGFIVLMFFLLFLLFFFVFMVVQFYNVMFRGFAPFIRTRKKILEKIIAEIKLVDGCKVYELGCGRAGFLRTLREKFPKVELVGVELQAIPYYIAQIQNSMNKTGIKIKQEDIFKTDISEADLIYTYLNIWSMKRLEEKLLRECRKGTQIVSFQFKLPNIKPNRILELDDGKNKVYFYTIK